MNSEFLQGADLPNAPWIATVQALEAATQREGASAEVWTALGDAYLRASGFAAMDPLSMGCLSVSESSNDGGRPGWSMALDAQKLQGARRAGEAYESALRLGDKSLEARRGIVLVQALSGELESIIARLRAYSAEDARSIDVCLELSIALAVLGDAEAVQIAEQTVATWPDMPDARRLLGWCLRAMGSSERGAEALRKSAMRFAQHPGLALDVAILSLDGWDDTETVRLARRAVHLDRQSFHAWLFLAQACSRIGDWEAAAEAASAALNIAADLPLAHCLLGTAQLEMDLRDLALDSLSRAFRERALWPAMTEYLAIALELSDRHRDALELLAHSGDSKTSVAVVLARQLRGRGKIEQALKCAREARLADPQDFEAQYELAECLLASGLGREVRSMLAEILVTNASDRRACELMAVACRDAEAIH